jgi:hypothetical protein
LIKGTQLTERFAEGPIWIAELAETAVGVPGRHLCPTRQARIYALSVKNVNGPI